jgi:hypothetical protein
MQPLFPFLDSHSSQVRVGTLLFLFLSCCISSFGRKAYCSSSMYPSLGFLSFLLMTMHQSGVSLKTLEGTLCGTPKAQ